MSDFGVIQEQGDLGLGFTPISEDEQEVVKEAYDETEAQEEN